MTTCEHEEHKHVEGNSSETTDCCGNSREMPEVEGDALASLKKEIISSVGQERRAPLSLGSVTVSVILGVLALASIVQVVQSASLYNKLKSSDLKPTASPASGSVSSQPAPSGLPNMVGGC